jgi:hypothetical protein
MLVFEDGNCPGKVYAGDQEDWNWLLAEGGFPLAVRPERISDGLVEVHDGEKVDYVEPMLYPSKRM